MTIGGAVVTFGDFLDHRWGDIIALCMMVTGVVLILHSHSDVGYPLLLSGAIVLRPTSGVFKNQNGGIK